MYNFQKFWIRLSLYGPNGNARSTFFGNIHIQAHPGTSVHHLQPFGYLFDIQRSFWYSLLCNKLCGWGIYFLEVNKQKNYNPLLVTSRHIQGCHTQNMQFYVYFKPNLHFSSILHMYFIVYSSSWSGSMVSGTRHNPGYSDPGSRQSHVPQIFWYSK